MNTTPNVTIDLDRRRRLAFDFNALCYLEREAGINVLAGFNLADFESPTRLLHLVTACLQTDAFENGEKSLSARTVGSYLTIDRMVEFTGQIERLVSGAMPEREPTADPPAAPAV